MSRHEMDSADTLELSDATTTECIGPRRSSVSVVNLDDQPPHDAVSREDVPPNGGYGWVCTACVFLMNAHTWGLNSVSNKYSLLKHKSYSRWVCINY